MNFLVNSMVNDYEGPGYIYLDASCSPVPCPKESQARVGASEKTNHLGRFSPTPRIFFHEPIVCIYFRFQGF
jgi:hypothetical protein